MYKRILLPLDGSLIAEAALQEVRKLAGDFGIEVILVYVVQPMQYLSPDTLFESLQIGIEDSLRNWAKEYLKNIVKDLKQAGIPATSIILRGYPADQIIACAAEKRVNLIVMTTRGRTGPFRWFLGSVSEKVSRLAKCPVMIVQPSRLRSTREDSRTPQLQQV
jgi:nucleotide-binding universal stress UspA family protein